MTEITTAELEQVCNEQLLRELLAREMVRSKNLEAEIEAWEQLMHERIGEMRDVLPYSVPEEEFHSRVAAFMDGLLDHAAARARELAASRPTLS